MRKSTKRRGKEWFFVLYTSHLTVYSQSNLQLNLEIFVGAERAEHISTTPSSGDSNNPIYNSSDKKYSAQNECDLYEETKPEHVYHYANPVQEIEDSTPPNEPHDYALPNSSARLAEKIHEGDPTGGNVLVRNASDLDNSKDETIDAHVYHVLENN